MDSFQLRWLGCGQEIASEKDWGKSGDLAEFEIPFRSGS
jgi:hypothetical protein